MQNVAKALTGFTAELLEKLFAWSQDKFKLSEVATKIQTWPTNVWTLNTFGLTQKSFLKLKLLRVLQLVTELYDRILSMKLKSNHLNILATTFHFFFTNNFVSSWSKKSCESCNEWQKMLFLFGDFCAICIWVHELNRTVAHWVGYWQKFYWIHA